MAKGGALTSELEALHKQLAGALKAKLAASPSAADLQCARQFVRDAGIGCGLKAPAGTVDGLIADLEELEDADFPEFADQ